MRVVALALVMMTLIGCKDRFRYDCQDPDNWKVEECQKPKCVAMGYCTEWLVNTGEEDEAEK